MVAIVEGTRKRHDEWGRGLWDSIRPDSHCWDDKKREGRVLPGYFHLIVTAILGMCRALMAGKDKGEML